MIGPFRGGRVVAVTGVTGDIAAYYFGAVGSGIWKTASAGTVWSPVFDKQPVSSIGAIAVADSDPKVVYVGTGEADIRSQFGFGDGVYKSTDAGQTWKNIGLGDTRQIAKILVNPRDANNVFVAALGHPYGSNEARGVYRSTDGGATWKKVLYTNADTGAADIAWDPDNAQVLFATMWNARRTVWSQYPPIEGPGSGLWKSIDGGDHWTQVRGNGLPAGMWRRAGIAVARKRVYLLVDERTAGGLYRSDDGGEHWIHVSVDPRITGRGWYFSNITVDPANPDVVYVPNVALYRSVDGGISFTVLKGAPGGDDYHILWIDRGDPRRMILGSDQGTNISFDHGETWSTWYNQPTAQMYHVITDNRFPYAVYGSQQDSGTAAVMSRTDHGEIDARDWFSVGGAESGYIAIDPKNSNLLYVGDTTGSLSRFDRRSGQGQNITPWPLRTGGFTAPISVQKYRFPWTAPLIFSPIEPNALYYGAQYLLKTIDGGLTWKAISPDLTGDKRKDLKQTDAGVTTGNAKALGYGVIYAIAPSPLKAGLIWVGSDTGLIHVTQDGGVTWKDVTPSGLSDWSKISQIEASHFDPAVAYASVDRHRLDDYKPYIYRTRDYGKTWKPIADGLREPGFVHAVREDPARKGLLYAGTEVDVAVSFDDGDHWQSLKLNLPSVSVRDLVVHGDDLVIGTFGRGFWILDNASPLRQANAQVAASAAFLYKPAAAIRMNPESFTGTPFPREEPKAPNPPDGAMIDFYLKTAAPGNSSLEILDAKGAVVRKFTPQAASPPRKPGAIADYWLGELPNFMPHAGINRFVWDLRYTPPGSEASEDSELGMPPQGPQVVPGVYQVRLSVAGQTLTQLLTVKLDPRSTATAVDLSKQLELSLSCTRALAKASQALRQTKAFADELAVRRGRAGQQADAKIGELQYDLTRILGAATAAAELTTALSVAGSADRTPPATAYAIYEQANKDLEGHLAAWKRLIETDLPMLNKMFAEAKVQPIEIVR